MSRLEYFARATIVKPLDGVEIVKHKVEMFHKHTPSVFNKRVKAVVRLYRKLLEYPEILASSAKMRSTILMKCNEYTDELKSRGETPPQIFEDIVVIMKIIEARPDYKDSSSQNTNILPKETATV